MTSLTDYTGPEHRCFDCGKLPAEHGENAKCPAEPSEYGRYEIDYDDPRDMDLYEGI